MSIQSTRRKGKGKVSPGELSDNPFIVQYKPPPGETEEERIHRVRKFQDAQRVSKEIDESLQEAKKLLERRRKGLRLLLLGQAEAGKSTVLKNFQMAFTPTQFQRERVVWKTIIQLNLINAVKMILDVLSNPPESSSSPSDSDSTLPPSPVSPSQLVNRKYRRLQLSLSPLLSVETNLNKILSTSSREFCVRAGSSWKSKLGFRDTTRRSLDTEHSNAMQNGAISDLTRMLEASSDDLMVLWADQEVRSILASNGIVNNHPGFFFLRDITRITSPKYEPTDSDILRARVTTLGIEEHHLICEGGEHNGSEFYITDVGGARSSRSSWIPFFDDAQAILFLAPLSFNQMLDEDKRVNRLEDTMMLWRGICSSALLAHCILVIFFNKKDILQNTLESGVSVNRYVPSYDGPNEIHAVTKYFKSRFKSSLKKLSPKPRPFISYETSAIDTRAMTAIIVVVHEGIVRNNLAESDII
ncbi:P-loop containing nucleoside triphosphate hydrolase protein [Marasmius fiardii PR-910]|nr:P-loop containing nucleoside triphosphate hydrolase protein [Marasmius fiardii PR-910]